MAFSTEDYKVLLDFERARTEGKSVSEFTGQTESKVSPEMQLELIGVDVEIRLQLGDSVLLDDYIYDFPHLCDRIPRVFAEVKTDFISTYCPIRGEKGKFPLRFSKYEITEELGRGGMGVVYAATECATGRSVAIKVLFLKRQDIVAEAEALSTATHPYICDVLEAGQHDGLPFMCMERIDGRNLKFYLDETGPFSNQDAAIAVGKVAEGLCRAHELGLVHFDIKLSNILLDQNGEPSVTDFGLATQSDSKMMLRSDMRGTLCYMAPEFFDDSFGVLGKTSDIYSLGIVLYELLTGIKPFLGQIDELVHQICRRPPSRPTDFEDVSVDPKLEKICLKAMSKRAKDRYQSMDEFAKSLSLWIGAKRESRWPLTLKNTSGSRINRLPRI